MRLIEVENINTDSDLTTARRSRYMLFKAQHII